nr:RNA-directed DNA polymerase, eukaryota, reverse transcriptase zinc-binding domain protein [Tanacetum cinerariifolium]
KFFIGAKQSDRKISWVAWEQVLAAKTSGGLGVSSFFALNHALLLKWVWRFISQGGSLWYHVIRALYGTSIANHSSCSSSCWSSILREVHVLDAKGFKFLSHCRICVGDGSKTKFWLDPWISEMALCDRFPRVFSLEFAKEVLVVDKMGAPSFCTSFHRQIRDGAENQQWTDLLSTLVPIRLSPSSDRWVCDLNGQGCLVIRPPTSTPKYLNGVVKSAQPIEEAP